MCFVGEGEVAAGGRVVHHLKRGEECRICKVAVSVPPRGEQSEDVNAAAGGCAGELTAGSEGCVERCVDIGWQLTRAHQRDERREGGGFLQTPGSFDKRVNSSAVPVRPLWREAEWIRVRARVRGVGVRARLRGEGEGSMRDLQDDMRPLARLRDGEPVGRVLAQRVLVVCDGLCRDGYSGQRGGDEALVHSAHVVCAEVGVAHE